MERLAATSALQIQQRKEWGEILTGFETRNSYVVADADGAELYAALEENRGFVLRTFLKAARPFTIHVVTLDGQPVLRVDRPFRFYFHTIEVRDGSGAVLGSIDRRFSLVRRRYTVSDAAGEPAFTLFGPILHPWTFRILDARDDEIGKITKRWSGLGKEAFTDADNFGVTFPPDLDVRQKALLLAAVLLIDFVHFENTGN